MIKLCGRENMKNSIKFLLAVFVFAPLYAGAAPVSQTAGSNLTQYNGAMGSMAGNQWNTMMNQRQGGQTAKADYGNCEALVLRCAKPKCSGTGCADFNVAKSIAAGCVNSNDACKKHGDALIEFIAGQLVSSSQAVAAQQQAAANAAVAEQSAAQISAMQQQMQMQMQQMQEQNNAQLASLQNALEESQRAAAEAQAAAVQQAAAPDVNTGLTAVQTAAAKSGVSEDTIARATITGQIMSGLEGVDTSLASLKSTMREAFRYAGCNEVNGDNCAGPKRVKKFKELSMKFFEPYDALVDNLDDALTRAQSVGVDMTDIYMMLNGSCNRWGEYICQTAAAKYGSLCQNNRSVKEGRVKKAGIECVSEAYIPPEYDTMCVLNKELGDTEVQEKWLYPEDNDKIRIGCASSALDGSILGRRRAGGKKGGISIDVLEYLISQDAPSTFGSGNTVNSNIVGAEIKKYCAVSNDTDLRSATVSKSLKPNVCCKNPGAMCNDSCEDETNSYISPVYALCSVHAYNAGKTENSERSDEQEEVKRIVGLKSTVIAQQMYKQYTMVESMIKRLKIMLEKATLKASLQVASGTSDDDGSSSDDDIALQDCEARGSQEALECIRANYTSMKPLVEKNKLKPKLKEQLINDIGVLGAHLNSSNTTAFNAYEDKATCGSDPKRLDKSKAQACLRTIMFGITKLNTQLSKKSSGGGYTFTIKNPEEDD